MRRLVGTAAVVVTALVVCAAPLRAGGTQRETGHLEIPSPGPRWSASSPCTVEPFVEAVVHTTTRARLADGYSATFTVDPSTRGAPFVLMPDPPVADLDITFLSPGRSVSFSRREPGGASGTVPSDSERAVVCLRTGAHVAFDYTAGP